MGRVAPGPEGDAARGLRPPGRRGREGLPVRHRDPRPGLPRPFVRRARAAPADRRLRVPAHAARSRHLACPRVFAQFTDLVANASGWAYAILFVLAFLDALVPVVPSETSVITAGVVASAGDLNLPLVIAFAGAGAVAGDNAAYFVGHRYGQRINDRFFRSER